LSLGEFGTGRIVNGDFEQRDKKIRRNGHRYWKFAENCRK
jgi:hypothetical protein